MNIPTIESVKRLTLITAAAIALAWTGALFAQTSESYELNIGAQDLGSAIMQYGVQTGNEVLFRDSDVQGLRTDGVRGRFTAEEAIRRLLQGNDVPYRTNADGTLIIGKTAIARASGEQSDEPAAKPAESPEQSDEESTITIDELRDPEAIDIEEEAAKELRGLLDVIIVTGSRNVSVRRFEDDAQPYVVFNSNDLERSAATNLEDFLRTRLPQNTAQASNQQFTSIDGSLGNTSSVNLRGLGANQTLILVNGRRAPRVSFNDGTTSEFQQADINGIPLASIERIEVLPATASGIYGGGATGGVVNIITRRDYSGGEVQLRYGNTTDGAFD